MADLFVRFLINPRKNKFIVFRARELVPKVVDIYISFLGQELVPEPYVKDLGILLDSNLSFNEHSASLVSTLLGTLCRINKIKPREDKGDREGIPHTHPIP